MNTTMASLCMAHRGILAADENIEAIASRFQAFGIAATESNRRHYREMLLSTPKLETYVSGAILFEETLEQRCSSGEPLVEVLNRKGIVAGIKADLGTVALPGADGELLTRGLDQLSTRIRRFRREGARFAKWRALFFLGPRRRPSDLAIAANAEALARFAAVCQEDGVVPVVEPEVSGDGDHTIEECDWATRRVLDGVFQALSRHTIALDKLILKPNMVVPGNRSPAQASAKDVATSTLRVLDQHVPASVQSINFLSGGQVPEMATELLNAINVNRDGHPWSLSYAFGRALQVPALQVWQGRRDFEVAAQAALLKRLRMNALALAGAWTVEQESGQPGIT